jgi:hypothetical protein
MARALILASIALVLASIVVAQNEGDAAVNWLLKDIDVYYEKQPFSELQTKLAVFKDEFTDETASLTGDCSSTTSQERLALVVENAIKYGFWNNCTIRSSYSEPMEVNEIIAYAGMPVPGIPLYETSYEMVSIADYEYHTASSSYIDLKYHTTHASLVDGFYQWKLSCTQTTYNEYELNIEHRKVARTNPNTAKVLLAAIPALDENADDFTEFLANNNNNSVHYHVETLMKIINEGQAPCVDDYNCWWQGLGPTPVSPPQ